MHEVNSFVTLTYKDDPGTLVYRDFQLFSKRLRKKRGRFRFYVAGEYGETLGRPHFHAILFGVGFPDQEYLGKSPAGFRLYKSEELSSVWQMGHAAVGGVTFESAAYCARYVMKKITGERAEEHYDGRRPEFARMSNGGGRRSDGSRNRGIGEPWFVRFGATDVAPGGKVVVNGHEANAPRYYMKLLQRRNPVEYERLVEERRLAGLRNFGEQAPKRLEDRQAVARARVSMLKRKI